MEPMFHSAYGIHMNYTEYTGHRIRLFTLKSPRWKAPNRIISRRRARRDTFNEVDLPRVSYRMQTLAGV